MPRDLSETDMMVLLSKRRRRLILRILRESRTTQTAPRLAKAIGELEYEDPSTEDLRTVYIALHHKHLPRLEDADAVTYDRDMGTVRPGPNFDALLRVLERVSERDEPWADG